MSIKKCIMNYFDKATNAMVPFHPQTESGAITDWHESIIGSLASKVLPTVVSELTTDSVMGKLMKMLLNASGVKYSIDTNGYVCLGSFFGGLIIQWGQADFAGLVYLDAAYPIKFSQEPLVVLTNDITGNSYQKQTVSSIHWGQNARADALHLLASSSDLRAVCWLAVGF
ncbi:hypothetical protein [Acidaminococcus sp.]|uniref:gp53-like domain-containing protein n=1 Tax=Acidaminococcus sp. TaxID=1872103 RepID=UPI0035221AAA